jgi:hypothetical protein
MPVIYERDKKKEKENGKEKEVAFDIRSLDIMSDNKAILNVVNAKTALNLHKQLTFFIHMSRTEGGKNKLNFEVSIVKNGLNTVSNNLQIEGDLVQAVNFFAKSYISENMKVEALEIINNFKKEERKESRNNIYPKQ